MPLQVEHGKRIHLPYSLLMNQPLSASDIVDLIAERCPHSRNEVIRALILLMRARDPQSHEHGERTAKYAVALGSAVGLTKGDLADLHVAALLHDIGRLTLPPTILRKRGPLSGEEYELVQCHPRAGAEILAALPPFDFPTLWIAHHHEHWDGSGYPYGLRGLFIPLGSRVLAVADVFDVVLAQQSSSDPARNFQSARRQLQGGSGTILEPDLVQTFLGMTRDPFELLVRCFTALAKD
jgi:HD-GYP domain-containing protein (c-di-GMP phosphodiesterase class II)